MVEKELWPEVLKSLNSSLTDDVAGAVRTLLQLYVKLLLPYECHVKHLNKAECLAKVHSSVLAHGRKMVPRVNHEDKKEMNELDDIIQGGKMNGEAAPQSIRISGRLNSQTSESSAGEINSQESDVGAMTAATQKDEEQPDLVLPDNSQASVSSYPPDMTSDEPLPEISAQETESLLAMPASLYPTPTPAASTGGPSTPSAGQGTPPSSFPPPYADWVPPPGQEMYQVPGYLPSYAVDPSPYRPPSHPSSMPPGYPPYNAPSQHDVPMDYHLEMSSPIVRSPYDGSPYHMGMPPAMHGLPGSRPNPYLFRPPMISQHNPYGVRSGEMVYQGAPGMGPEWAWQQGSRFPSVMHHHSSMYSPSRQNSSMQQLSSSRMHTTAQSSVLGSQHRPTSTSSSDSSKPHWQEQAKPTQSPRAVDKATPPSRSSKSDTTSKSGSSKPDQSQLVDSLKRPLPDWSECVEGTKPVLVKRRHLLSADCGTLIASVYNLKFSCIIVVR